MKTIHVSKRAKVQLLCTTWPSWNNHKTLNLVSPLSDSVGDVIDIFGSIVFLVPWVNREEPWDDVRVSPMSNGMILSLLVNQITL